MMVGYMDLLEYKPVAIRIVQLPVLKLDMGTPKLEESINQV